jgi:uncharacterized membrane protein YiaA
VTIVVLPFLFWLTFNLQGYFFTIFTAQGFDPIGLQHTVRLDVPEEYRGILYVVITGAVLLALSLVFAGAAMFSKQPLVKTLFAVAVVILFFAGYSYVLVEPLGLGRYNPPEQMVLVPMDEWSAFRALIAALFAATVVMLVVAYLKLKEREV